MHRRLERVRAALAASPPSSMSLRLVEFDDAAFICALRDDATVNRFISATPPGLEQQREWIAHYKHREAEGTEFYFLISCRERPFGTVRITDTSSDDGRCFELGSFVVRKSPPDLAIYACVAVLSIGFDVLAFERSHFRIFAQNMRARDAVRHMGATIMRYEADEVLYDYPLSAFEAFRRRFGPRLDRLSGKGYGRADAESSC